MNNFRIRNDIPDLFHATIGRIPVFVPIVLRLFLMLARVLSVSYILQFDIDMDFHGLSG